MWCFLLAYSVYWKPSFMTLFGFFISLKTDLQLSQRTKASSNRSSDSGDVTQQVVFYTQIKGDVENLILNNYLLRNQKSAYMSS